MRRWIAASVVVTAALAAAAPSAAADPYVALGDSVAAGTGTYVSKLYPMFQHGLAADELLNRAGSGGSSETLRFGGQLSTAIDDINAASDTKAVTIDIGANDRFQCNGHWDEPGTCALRANLNSILSQLQSALDADPGAEAFAVMAYYNPGVGTSNEHSYDVDLLGENLAIGAGDTGADVGLNDVIHQEAGKLAIPVADVYAAFKQGGPSYMSGDGLHPNQAGQQAIADVFCATLIGACATGDIEPPQTEITKHPGKRIDRTRARYSFTSSEPGTFECNFDGGGYERCNSPKTLKRLDVGPHRFYVRAIDRADNADPTAAVHRFRVTGN